MHGMALTLWELTMFHMGFRIFRNELGSKDAGRESSIKVVSLRCHNSLESGDILTGIQTCIPKRMDSRLR